MTAPAKRAPLFFTVPARTPPDACKSCRKLCYWIITKKGNRMLVDCDVPGGIFPTTSEAGRGFAHFATCPNAVEHRRPR